MYSFDDQYNIVSLNINRNHNLKIPNFFAIDYFQFQFNELQLHNCWKLIREVHIDNNKSVHVPPTLHSDNEFINRFIIDRNCFIPQSTDIRRLENLIWRKWMKTKYNLKETNPIRVNWYKDCDITVLYGPLVESPFDHDPSFASFSNQQQPRSHLQSQPHQNQNQLHSAKPHLSKYSYNYYNSNRRSNSFSSMDSSDTFSDDDDCFDQASHRRCVKAHGSTTHNNSRCQNNSHNHCHSQSHNSTAERSVSFENHAVLISDSDTESSEDEEEIEYLKPILKKTPLNSPLAFDFDFKKYFESLAIGTPPKDVDVASHNKSVSFAAMVQIRQF